MWNGKPHAWVAMIGLVGCGVEETTDSTEQAVMTRYELAATGLWDPFGLFGDPVGGFDLSNATLICPGHPHDPTRTVCPPGGSTYYRGYVFTNRVTGSGPNAALITGDGSVDLGLNWDENGTGPLWGTFRVAIDAGGAWEGTFQGKREMLPAGCAGTTCWVEQLHIRGVGVGGIIDGMQGRFAETIYSHAAVPPAFTSTFTGEAWLPH